MGTVIVPPLADAFGRKYVFAGSNVIQIAALIGLLVTTELTEAYVYIGILGFSFVGVVLIGINYLVELQKKEWQDAAVLSILPMSAFAGVAALYYQVISRSYLWLQVFMLIIAVLTGLYFLLLVPESPKW